LSYDDTWTQVPPGSDQPHSVFDMRGDAGSVARALSGEMRLAAPDASTPGDPETRVSIDEAQACLDATNDFFQRRFGRTGLDNHGRRVRMLINPQMDPAANDLYPKFAAGAYYGGGDVVLGARAGGLSFLDVLGLVAHEVAHGITEYSSGLIYLDESGALNEAFSDIMATSARLDVETAGGTTDPPRWPDAFTGTQAPAAATTADNGGVHAHAATITHVFWIGATTADRKEIERVFYRAFTSLVPANATFNIARAATIQSAIDLDGAGSDVERAVTAAWAAGLR
jgi:Zn-dependent metalloprotease